MTTAYTCTYATLHGHHANKCYLQDSDMHALSIYTVYIYIYVMYCQVWWPILEIGPLHLTHPSEHTHCEHAPGAVGSHCSSARGAIGGSVPCSRAPQSWFWRWRECCSFKIPTFNPCQTWDSNPQPLDYKSDSLTIRPRLPSVHASLHICMHR